MVRRRVAPQLLVAVVLLGGAASCSDGDDAVGRASTSTVPHGCVAEPERIVDGTENPPGIIRDEAPTEAPDTDGDGVPDGMEHADGGVRFLRAGGNELQFRSPRGQVAVQSAADLDGDGDDDPILTVAGTEPATYVVAGSPSARTTSPEEAGVRIEPELAFPWPDLAGEPGVDLIVVVRGTGASYTEVYDGAAVLDEGAGADARSLEPTTTLTGLPRVRIPLAEGAEPETLLLVPGEPAEVRFAARPKAVYRASLGPGGRVEDLFVFEEGGARKIALRVDERLAVWPVPPPCA